MEFLDNNNYSILFDENIHMQYRYASYWLYFASKRVGKKGVRTEKWIIYIFAD